jgi:hypothetical protein
MKSDITKFAASQPRLMQTKSHDSSMRDGYDNPAVQLLYPCECAHGAPQSDHISGRQPDF